MIEAPRRILEISRDPLFKAVYPDRTTWVQTGRPLEPYGRFAGHAAFERSSLASAVVGLAARRFDFAVLPAIRASVPGDAHNRRKAKVRAALTRLGGLGAVTGAVGSVLGLRSTPHIIRDVGDFPDLDEVGTAWLPDALIYSKREVLEAHLDRSPLSMPVVYTPMPFEFAPYDHTALPEKEVDVFFAARPVGELRRQATEALDILEREGVSVDRPDGRIPFDEYLKRMAAARLVLSPRGQGEHCYRHYEALLVGSVPMINRPLRPVHYDLQHRQTCWFYEPTEDGLRQQIALALGEPELLASIASDGRALVRSRHDKRSICEMLLDRARSAP